MSDDRVDRIELANALVLSLAAMGIAWATYQASLWDGDQAAAYSQASTLRLQSNRVAGEAELLRAVEVGMFNSWLEASSTGDTRRADFYAARFPLEMRQPFAEWLATKPLATPGAPATPFAMASYRSTGQARAVDLDHRANETFDDGQRANDVSDAFVQGSTVLSLALFFAGIGQVFRMRRLRWALLSLAALACAAGLFRIITLPVISLITGATST
jgi:hypothetical protein